MKKGDWMRINQFGLKEESLTKMKEELATIGFKKNGTTKEMWQAFLLKSFPQYQEESSVKNLWTRLLATKTQTLADFLKSETPLTQGVFYHVALQLLQFDVNTFFEVEDSVKKAKENGLLIIDGDFTTEDTLVKAWYTLLNTHNTKGLTFLDDLAARGFYQDLDLPKPFFFNGKAQAVFDAKNAIQEVVYIESNLDTDEDGKRDLLKIEIIRPKETEAGLRVPVLFTASPYDQGINHTLGEKKMHNVNVPLERKEPNTLTYEEIAFKGKDSTLPPEREVLDESKYPTETFYEEKAYSLNDYLLARGFASVYGAGIGTKDSDGIQTCGSIEQTEAMKNIVEWLAGNRRAFTNRTDNIEVKAWWCNQKVAMTGRSYLGTLATAVATTGVEGLETIISEAAISNWYQYYRDNGLVIAPGGFPGEDCDVLAEETFSRSLEGGDYLKIKAFFDKKQKEMAQLQDRRTGNYNTFWDERNYLPHVKNIKCDIFMVHGVNDWNVKPRHVYQLWQELDKMNLNKKIILHQGEHIYINNMPSFDFHDVINFWVTNKLYGYENGANDVLPNVIVQDNVEKEHWQGYQTWEDETTAKKSFILSENTLGEETSNKILSFSDQLPQETFTMYTKQISKWEEDLKKEVSPLEKNRLIFKTESVKEEFLLTGAPKLKLRVASSVDFGMLSFQLVDYGTTKRLNITPSMLASKALNLGHDWRFDALKEFTLGKETDFKMITKGHINLQNRHNPYQVDDLKAGEFVEIEVELQPSFHKVLKGHQLGLVVYATDFGMTVRGNQDISYQIDLKDSQLEIPYL